MKKWIFSIIGILVIGLAGYYFFATKSNNQRASLLSQARQATVLKGKFTVKVSGTGTVQPITSEDIKSTINNNSIDQVLVSSGDSVTSGQKLITFTDGSTPITAPASGVITSIPVLPGERVQIGETVAHLTNYTNLKTVAQIDELDIAKVKVGQSATIKVNALPDQTFTGKVTSISNEGTSTNGVTNFDVTVSIDHPKNIKVGMSTETSILTAMKDHALYVPLEAVHTLNGQKFVILASNQSGQSQTQGQSQGQNWNANRVPVKTGLSNEDNVEITQGLTEGQTVRLPNLAVSNSSVTNGNTRGLMGGFGGMGSGINRSNRGNGNGGGNFSGRSGN